MNMRAPQQGHGRGNMCGSSGAAARDGCGDLDATGKMQPYGCVSVPPNLSDYTPARKRPTPLLLPAAATGSRPVGPRAVSVDLSDKLCKRRPCKGVPEMSRVRPHREIGPRRPVLRLPVGQGHFRTHGPSKSNRSRPLSNRSLAFAFGYANLAGRDRRPISLNFGLQLEAVPARDSV